MLYADIPTSAHLPTGPARLEEPLYYLHNFIWVIRWVLSRHGDLLNGAEKQFIEDFQTLPLASQGLLVRMIMRKGALFRADKLQYAELGDTVTALGPLVARGWVDPAPALSIHELFKLFRWSELQRMLAPHLAKLERQKLTKSEALLALTEMDFPTARMQEWGGLDEIYALQVMPLCDRFRVMFFGNAHQDWSEFVLTELGHYQYETVEFKEESRPFHNREEIDAYLQLQYCRDLLYDGASLEHVLQELPFLPSANPWLLRRRERLLFKLAREWERTGELLRAKELYSQCQYPGARGRLLRVLELTQAYEQALELAELAAATPQNEAERQQLQRMLPRLKRKLGLGSEATRKPQIKLDEFELVLPRSSSVEHAVAENLNTAQEPVFYVENTLLNGLFGLLCWDAIFAPIPGAFFHPFQRGPADMLWEDFYLRRKTLFDQRLDTLDSNTHQQIILQNFRLKNGRLSPFTHWSVLSEPLLDLALGCIPGSELKLCFQRLLQDIAANRAGLPDLIQFWPQQRRYRMIEVKAPGDRVQDNQRRWLTYFAEHKIPAAVCYVRWQDGEQKT